MSMTTLTVTVSIAWWFRFYAWGVMTVCFVTGLEPDWEKVEAMIRRAIRMKVK